MKGSQIVEDVYRDANMSLFTLKELLKELQTRDNKITVDLEHLMKGYERYLKDAKELLKKEDGDLKKVGFMQKMMAKEGIQKNVKSDNSDASIADMLVKGISMGTLDMEKKLKKYGEEADKKVLKLAHDFMEFGKDNMTALKKYL